MPSETQPTPRKFYLTTPIYYVNGRPHIGHAYTNIVADVLARRHRVLGDETYFLTGTDEHGQKVERSAAAAGVSPQQFADMVSAEFRELWDRMGLTYDDFLRTTEDRHKAGVQKLFRTLFERGHIYLSTYTGSYCVSDEAFVDQPAGTPCPDCGRLLETVTEENFFFRLSAFQQPLLELMESNTLRITPEAARNEVLSFVRGGLKDLSVSRSSFSWGIPVPADIQKDAGATQPHVTYVWMDALANYMTAIGYGDESAEAQAKFAHLWPADLHLVGKEITRFHCVYWPAFLLAAGLPTPSQITANGWLLFDNAKMSKSKGNVVRTETILDAFGDQVYGKQFPESSRDDRDLFASDVLRYFLLREIPFGQDGSFSFEALVTRYNADLANGYGNLVSRTLSLVLKSSAGAIEDCPEAHSLLAYRPALEASEGRPAQEEQLGASECQLFARRLRELSEQFHTQMDAQSPTDALAAAAAAIAAVDGLMTARKPWAAAESDSSQQDRRSTLYTAAEAIRWLTAMLYPVLPNATSKVWSQLGLGDIEQAARKGELNNLEWGGLKPGTRLGALGPIFPRADKSLAQVMTDMEDSRNSSAPKLPIQEASAIPMATEAGLPAARASLAAEKMPTGAEDKPSTDPAAAPRTSSLDAPSGPLTVGGSGAPGATLPTTPGPHTAAPASGLFAPAPQAATTGAADATQTITIDDFLKVELRVAQVLVAERIPKADKLLRLEVDLGTEKRQILSGIAQWYTPEELVGRRIVVVSNLAPRKMRGLDSHGMLLAASEGADGKPVLATFGQDIALGSRVR